MPMMRMSSQGSPMEVVAQRSLRNYFSMLETLRVERQPRRGGARHSVGAAGAGEARGRAVQRR